MANIYGTFRIVWVISNLYPTILQRVDCRERADPWNLTNWTKNHTQKRSMSGKYDKIDVVDGQIPDSDGQGSVECCH